MSKKITEALRKLLPADAVREVEAAVNEMMAEARAAMEAEYNQKLTETYEQVSQELAAAEETANEGYQQAFEIIQDQELRLERQAEEYEAKMDEGYTEAFEMLQAEKAKNDNIEVELYEEFNSKLKQMHDYMVEALDKYMSVHSAEIYEHAHRDLLNDPRLVEEKVALSKIVEIAAGYATDGQFVGTSHAKLEETIKTVEDLRGHVRVLEARNVRLSGQNNKLNEQVREAQNMINESTKVERKERAKVAGTVSGRGQRVLGEQVIPEYTNSQGSKVVENDQNLIEANEVLDEMLVLSGLKLRD